MTTRTTRHFILVLATLLAALSVSSTANAFNSKHSLRYANSLFFQAASGYYEPDLRPRARSDSYESVAGELFEQNLNLNDFIGNAPSQTRLIAGQLPEGLSISNDGMLTGTPAEPGYYYTIYKLTDADGDRSYARLRINISAPNLLPEANDDEFQAQNGVGFSANVIANNDLQGDGQATAELSGGELPPGLTLNIDGSITGTPTVTGIFDAFYAITDSDGDVSSASVSITVTELVAYCPGSAISDSLHDASHSHSIWINGISENLRFTAAPEATRILPNGNVTVTGKVADGDIRFDVVLSYSGYTATSDSPKLELNPDAYVENGGPIDPSSWEFFSEFNATLTGTSGEWEGVVLSAGLRGPMAQIGVGANGKNGNFGLANWFDATIESASGELPQGFYLGQVLSGDVNIDLPDECSRDVVAQQCAISAAPDAYARSEITHSILISNIPDRELLFNPEALVEVYDNGDVTVTGTVVGTYSGAMLDVVLEYTNATDVTQLGAQRQLISSAYLENGGPVDTSTWTYFESFKGTFTGVSGDAMFDGVVFEAAIRGELPQIGFGANGKNINFGISNWFDLTVVEAPESGSRFAVGDTFIGDVNLDINDDCAREPVVKQCSISAAPDAYARSEITHSILISNIPDRELLFNPEALVEIYAVDTSTWTYFESFKGTFTGVSGDATFDGVVFEAEIRGELPQIGFGANGKNINFGISNWFDLTVVEAPESGSRFSVGDTFIGDVNLDINDDCAPEPVVHQCSISD